MMQLGMGLVVAALALGGCVVGKGDAGGEGGFGGTFVGFSGSGGFSGVGVAGSAGFSGAGFDAGFDSGLFCDRLCPPLAGVLLGLLTPCCTDTGACGAVSPVLFQTCARIDDPGVPAPGCPSETSVFTPLEGCCTSDGYCGLATSSFGIGCVHRADFADSSFVIIDPATRWLSCGAPNFDAGDEDASVSLCEWARLNRVCDEHASCADDSGVPVCSCPAGFLDLDTQTPGQSCADLNECLETPSPCAEGQRCVNAPGSYTCVIDAN